jgi:hypothetical protein
MMISVGRVIDLDFTGRDLNISYPSQSGAQMACKTLFPNTVNFLDHS